jgi:hypothetical protein
MGMILAILVKLILKRVFTVANISIRLATAETCKRISLAYPLATSDHTNNAVPSHITVPKLIQMPN